MAYSNTTIPSILQITLQGVDLLANARPLGRGLSGAIVPCMEMAQKFHYSKVVIKLGPRSVRPSLVTETAVRSSALIIAGVVPANIWRLTIRL